MSCVVGIICEYNPFHKGHKYQIDRIREEMPDATIICIMSGNIVQRGEFAMLDKYDRARLALECGANGVFEIPYPYSGSTAEIFANAGVTLANKLYCDYICFGIENESIENLEKIAFAIDTKEFENAIKKHLSNKENGYILAKQQALKDLGFDMPKSANDILAIEYIRAIRSNNLPLKYIAIKRLGAEYKDTSVCDIMSASAIRSFYIEKQQLISVPNELINEYNKLVEEKKVLDYSSQERFLHTYVLLNGDKIKHHFDSNAEIASVAIKCAKNSTDSHEFLSSLSTKSLTSARIKRAIMYSIFDVNKVDFSPQFTIMLGIDSKGLLLMSKIKKMLEITVVTKHSDIKNASEEIRLMAEKQYHVDSIYYTLLKKQFPASQAYKNKPIIK